MTKQEMINLIQKLIQTGEKVDVEFKESKDNLNKDVYESVCSFNNRDGGYIILGVVDKTKEICGVNLDKVDKMKKDFTTAINNANKINPPIYLTPEDINIGNKVESCYTEDIGTFEEDNLFHIKSEEGARQLAANFWETLYEIEARVEEFGREVLRPYLVTE